MAEKEYIEREAAIDALTERNLVVHMDSVNDGLVASCHRSAQRIIANMPAADVRPVVRGMWTKELHPNVRYNQYKCSICGEFSGHDSEGWIWKPNFCPNCGADMREES